MSKRRYTRIDDAFNDLEKDWKAEEQRLRDKTKAAAIAFGAVVEENIHKQSGRLAASVNVETNDFADRVETAVSVGGSAARYAVYENSRRGHSLFGYKDERAYEATLDAIWGGKPSEDKGSTHSNGRQAIE